MCKPILAVAVLAVALTPALSHAGGTEDSTITVVDAGGSSLGTVISGIVDTSTKCRKGRTVELYDRGKDGSVLEVFDEDTTSNRGAWAVVLKKSDGPNNLFVRVLKSNAGSTKCGAAKSIVVF